MIVNKRKHVQKIVIASALLVAGLFLFLNYSKYIFRANEINNGEVQIANLTNNGTQIPKYDEFELTFDVNWYKNRDFANPTAKYNPISTGAVNPYWPYDPSPAANTQANIDSRGDGKMPVEPGKGVSVDGVFTSPTGQVVTQPGFYYQDYDYVKRIGQYDKPYDWLYPKGNPQWKIRFAPTKEGSWQYKIRVKDITGEINYYPTTNIFFATSSQNHGFVKASDKDSRYFETSDGKYLQLTGLNDYTGLGDLENRYKDLKGMGINLLRPWWQASQEPAVFGISGQGGSKNWYMVYPNQDIWTFNTDIATGDGKVQPGHLFSMPIDGSKGKGTFGTSAYVKPNTKYKLSAWVKTENLVGTGDFGAYLSCSNCLETSPLNVKFKGTDWTELPATITSRDGSYSMDLSMSADNTTGGNTYLSGISLKEINTDQSLGPELVSKPNYDVEQYVSPDQSWIADYSINKAKENDIYLKPVIEEKADILFGRIGANGLAVSNRDDNNVYAWGTHASRTYQNYFWRYMIARYSSYTNLQSFELFNEADPFNGNHYDAVDALGKYLKANDPNNHLSTSSTWHSFPQEMWRNSNIGIADFHNDFRNTLWPGWDGNWADTNRSTKTMTPSFEIDNSAAHSGGNSLKLTMPPNIDDNGVLNTKDVIAGRFKQFSPAKDFVDSNLSFHAGVEPGHKIEISSWIKAQNIAKPSASYWNVPGLSFSFTTGEGGWTGWPPGGVSAPAKTVPQGGPESYDWQKVAYQVYTPSYYNVVIDSANNVHAVNAGPTNYGNNSTIINFDQNAPEGKRTSVFDTRAAKSFAIDASGNYFVANLLYGKIDKFAGGISTWPPTASYGSVGSGDGQFNSPSGIALDSGGNMYITDTGNNRIQKLNSSGQFTAKWGSAGSGDGQFNSLSSIAMDKDNNIYVTDTGNNRIQKFDANGQFLAKWGSGGSGNGQFSSPAGLTVDKNNDFVYVADTKNNRIQKFSLSGQFISKFGQYGTNDREFKEPQGVAVDTGGNIYVADTGNTRIQKFDPNANYIRKYTDNAEFGTGAYNLGLSVRNQPTMSAQAGYLWFDDIEVKDLNTRKLLNYNGDFENMNRTSYDIVTGYLSHSRKAASYQLGKPVIQGESGINAPQRFSGNYKGKGMDGDQLLYNDPDGTWWKKLTWASIDSSGLIEMFWGQRNILYNQQYKFAKIFKDFMSGIELNNGNYQDIAASTSTTSLRTLGQKEIIDGKADKAHLWIDNKNYTWKAVADHNFNINDITWTSTDTYPKDTTAYQNGNIYKSLQNDNKNHSVSSTTWWQEISLNDFLKLNDMPSLNPSLPVPISGDITIPEMKPDTTFNLEWWDTSEPDPSKQIIQTTQASSDNQGNLTFSVANLTSDIAVKISVTGENPVPTSSPFIVPTPTPIAPLTPTPTPSTSTSAPTSPTPSAVSSPTPAPSATTVTPTGTGSGTSSVIKSIKGTATKIINKTKLIAKKAVNKTKIITKKAVDKTKVKFKQVVDKWKLILELRKNKK